MKRNSGGRTPRVERISTCIALCTIGIALWSRNVLAYRPFDSTDASVADAGQFELELGAAGSLHEGAEASFIASAFVANFGLMKDREIIVEGVVKTTAGDSADDPRTSLVDAALSLKQVHRRGGLQESTGPSIASECGVLLPGIHAESGTGAICAGILSQRWMWATVHVNAGLEFTREHDWGRQLGVILEGPHEWPIRPAIELFTDGDASDRTRSVLIGMIWRHRMDFSVDAGIRTAKSNSGETTSELRAGFTWTH
jgi:hypothetical protein